MSTCIALIIGLILGGIVSFFITAVLIAEERSGRQHWYQIGYDQGYRDGSERKGE